MDPSLIFIGAANEKLKEQEEIIRILKEENGELKKELEILQKA